MPGDQKRGGQEGSEAVVQSLADLLPKASVLQPPRNKKLNLFHQDQVRKPIKYSVLQDSSSIFPK